ncbi:hypothetical protein C8F04DRAFT_1040594 [Mycena alexandri]|uniref:Heterokaryon incompatibility domain-containing protein n=1 Tax=Mycena alexandri TaxID=1745969 RepID=A0AAD6SR88_9AGAR|nr:hypothetical protein C8F04DRAFT_1040594 [Mycena alexandri]
MTTAPFKESYTRTVKVVKTFQSSPAPPPISRYSVHLSRLLREDDRIEGCFFFHRTSDQPLHIAGNIARILFKIVTAPLFQCAPYEVTESVLNLSKWKVEYADTPAAVLADTMGKNRPQYSVTGFKPTWLLKVVIKDGELSEHTQVPFTAAIEAQGYTALSYPMQSAVQLCEESDFHPPVLSTEGRQYTLADRRSISKYVLLLYCSATRHLEDGNPEGANRDRTEYVWLDEFCLSHPQSTSESEVESQRSTELGRLADIFRNAAQVAVFCHRPGCPHTNLDCPWGNRIWTIPEILHAERVLRMTREYTDSTTITRIHPTSGRAFREEIQKSAADSNQWHLYAIYQHSVNSGGVSWQTAIHSLVVEAIRRDEAGHFDDHKFLGKALNGLLPRRAHVDDLGHGGWNDLAWLLELNQGFYNAASLAALCSLPDHSSVSWLGKPIQPMPGNERLEALVTALPVSPPTANSSSGCPPLMIIGGEMIGLRPRLRRDWAGLYNNPDMIRVRVIAGGILALGVLVSVVLFITGNIFPFIGIFFSVCIGHVILELVVSTMFLERKGWIFLPDSEWADLNTIEQILGRELKLWGKLQLAPKWEDPTKRRCTPGRLVDLEHGIYIETNVVELPNVLAPMAIHGNGITCVLLHRKNRQHEQFFGAQKVGIANFPPHILAQTTKMGTMCIGSQWEEKEKEKEKVE